MSNDTAASGMSVYVNLDITLSIVCLVVFIFGLPGNLFALIYFLSRGRDLPTWLYTLLSFIDSSICAFILPVGLTLANKRQPVLFNWNVMCTVWGAVWTWAPYMSVFLIAVLSITRTLVLLNPLRIISKSKVIIMAVIYGLIIAIRMVAPMVYEGPEYNYLNKTVECMWSSEDDIFNNISLITVYIFLFLPVLPILVSCVLSIHVITSSMETTKSSTHATAAKRSATITIVILTSTYLIFNFPLFLYLAMFSVYFIRKDMENWLGGSVTLDSYLWTAVYIILIGINSLSNFIVYFCRIRQFRNFMFSLLPWKTKYLVHSHTGHTAMNLEIRPSSPTTYNLKAGNTSFKAPSSLETLTASTSRSGPKPLTASQRFKRAVLGSLRFQSFSRTSL